MDDSKNVRKAQDFIPHTCNFFLREILQQVRRGLTQEQVVWYIQKDKNYFKPTKA